MDTNLPVSTGTKRRVVVKVGSSSLTDEHGGFRLGPVAALVDALSRLHADGTEVLFVSSGAVSTGMGLLGFAERPKEVVALQAASAVGQGRLFHTYSELFSLRKVVTAQVLLTAGDINQRTNYLNARNTLETLLSWHVLPILNENDTTSTEELTFGDNDTLAAQVALLVGASHLILLTDIEGVYDRDPREPGPEPATLISEVRDFATLDSVVLGDQGRIGRGGMRSKVNAARIATAGGVETVIACSVIPDVLARVLAGESIGTRFVAGPRELSAFKLWLLYAKPPRGTLKIDAGAFEALKKGSSLLPVGVTAVTGQFDEGDAVDVLGPEGQRVAKGIVNYPASEAVAIKGLRSQDVAARYPGAPAELIHHNYLALV